LSLLREGEMSIIGYVCIGGIIGILLTTLAMVGAAALCRAAAMQDPESDEYREVIK